MPEARPGNGTTVGSQQRSDHTQASGFSRLPSFIWEDGPPVLYSTASSEEGAAQRKSWGDHKEDKESRALQLAPEQQKTRPSRQMRDLSF